MFEGSSEMVGCPNRGTISPLSEGLIPVSGPTCIQEFAILEDSDTICLAKVRK